MDVAAFQIVALISGGMGFAVWITERGTPTSRALGLFLVAMGIVILASAHAPQAAPLPAWTRLLGTFDAIAFIAATEWGIRVGETVTSRSQVGPVRLLVRAAQGCVVAFAALAAWRPQWRVGLSGQLDLSLSTSPDLGFYVLSTPWAVAMLLVMWAGVRVLQRGPDKAEQARIGSMLAVMPLFAGALALPRDLAPIAIALGEIVFLIGALRYHNVQGARALFLAQFLSPQVVEMVRKRGLRNAMTRTRQTVSIVCCDIRGFTAYAQGNPPERVMRLLRDFYSDVGAVTAEFGGTIKDLAGDGALILIGAPMPYRDEAARALGLARGLQARARDTVRGYSRKLGLGVGVATGQVAVGIVGQRARYEYVAVGPAVNLAARLCDEARDGEVRVDGDTLKAAREPLPSNSELRPLKGVGREVPTYVISAAAAD
ncbi:MAG: adenylate/guanylate cyclase domain-containing protein [Gammaproteobacteria bacterium]